MSSMGTTIANGCLHGRAMAGSVATKAQRVESSAATVDNRNETNSDSIRIGTVEYRKQEEKAGQAAKIMPHVWICQLYIYIKI